MALHRRVYTFGDKDYERLTGKSMADKTPSLLSEKPCS